MTILTEAELKRRMGMTIDPNSIPRHDGGDQGCMEANIRPGSDTVVTEQGKGRRGTAVYEGKELGDPRFFGSATVITVTDDRPIAPEPAPVTPRPRSPEELLAMLGLTKKR